VAYELLSIDLALASLAARKKGCQKARKALEPRPSPTRKLPKPHEWQQKHLQSGRSTHGYAPCSANSPATRRAPFSLWALVPPLVRYIDMLDMLRDVNPRRTLSVILPHFVSAHWWEGLLHNQTACYFRQRLGERAEKSSSPTRRELLSQLLSNGRSRVRRGHPVTVRGSSNADFMGISW
jgi:hypothetical protein